MTPPVRIYRTHPVLAVADVVAAARYYRDRLGFKYDRFWGDPPCFVMLRRDLTEIFLRSPVSGPVALNPRPYDQCSGWDIYIRVSDADALAAEFLVREVVIARQLQTMPYEMREFEVQDLDGHVLCFASDASAPVSSLS